MPRWRGDDVSVKQLAEDFGRYVYLPRLVDTIVLHNAVTDGMALITWESGTLVYADSFDDVATRYRGLRRCERVAVAEVHQLRVRG